MPEVTINDRLSFRMTTPRRDFLTAAAVAGVMAATRTGRAAEPPAKSPFGITIYSLLLKREALKQDGATVDLFEPIRFLEYAHQLGYAGIQVPLGYAAARKEMAALLQAGWKSELPE